jgi:hypothetical protein
MAMCYVFPTSVYDTMPLALKPKKPEALPSSMDFDEEASRTTLHHRVVSAEASVHFLQHSLNKLLLGDEALAPIRCQLSYC